MPRYLKYRCYQFTKKAACLIPIVLVISFIILTKLLTASEYRDNQHIHKVVTKKVISDEEKLIRQMIHLTEKVTLDEDHEYTIIRFSEFQTGHQSKDETFVRDGRYIYFQPTFRLVKLLSPAWFYRGERFCNGGFMSYGKIVTRLKNALIDPSYGKNVRGGERLKAVLNQSEDVEYLRLEKGYFYLMTLSQMPHYKDKFVSYDFKLFLDALNVENIQLTSDKVQQKTTIVIVRHEYANYYHTSADWYGIFLIMILFHIDNHTLQILWLDGHPKSNLDETWRKLFGDVQQARTIKEPVLYKDMIWDTIGARSPFNEFKAETLPYSNEFRHFFMSQHGVNDSHVKDCKSLTIRLILRHNYLAHPRNTKGDMTRKIKNEKEILAALVDAFEEDKVEKLVLESMKMKNQIELISQTDILIGMHGAGLTHILFLPDTSGVIELMPKYVSPSNKHFESLSKWRKLDYMIWRNEDDKLEKNNYFTKIPEDLLIAMVGKMREMLCGKVVDKSKRLKSEDKEISSYDIN